MMSGSRPRGGLSQSIKDLWFAVREQARYKRSWPLLALILIFLVPSPVFGLWLGIRAYINAAFGFDLSFGADITWLKWWSSCSVALLVVVAFSLAKAQEAVRKVLEETGREILPGQDPREDILLAEVKAAADELGLEPPPVFIYQPRPNDCIDFTGVFAGLLDAGQIAITKSTWSRCEESGEIRVLVRHELAHIKHRDGFVGTVLAAITLPFAWLLMAAVMITGFFSLPVVFAACWYILACIFGSPRTIQPAQINLHTAVNPVWLLMVKGTLALLIVTALLEAYRCWGSRARERAADRFAVRSVGSRDVQRGLALIRLEEGVYGEKPAPVTWLGCQISGRALVGWMSGSRAPRQKRADALQGWGRMVGNLIAGPLFVVLHLPGASVVRRVMWRLYRTHPTPSEREAAAMKILEEDGRCA